MLCLKPDVFESIISTLNKPKYLKNEVRSERSVKDSSIEHYGIYTRPLTIKLIIFEGGKSRVSRYFFIFLYLDIYFLYI